MFTKKEIEKFENEKLSSLAMKSKFSRGRVHEEPEHPYRSIYQRDRDRIIHSEAFRRLEYKTQVYVYHVGDYYRTRLTHTLEVAQIGRTIARALRLNEDLTEALCLAHDLGHPPFGHAGESALNKLMVNSGGFDHNIQSLRIVDKIEKRYPTFIGLNLSWETREGIIKHTTKYDNVGKFLEGFPDLRPKEQPTLEAQIMDKADEIAYNNHDLDDGIKSDILSSESLQKLELWKMVAKDVKKRYSRIEKHIFNYLVIKNIINKLISDLITTTDKNINKLGSKKISNIKNRPRDIIAFSKDADELNSELRGFLNANFYNHYLVKRMSLKYTHFLEKLFVVYYAEPDILKPYFRDKIKSEKNTSKKKRIICDYIAGMTDRYALEEYRKIFDVHEKI